MFLTKLVPQISMPIAVIKVRLNETMMYDLFGFSSLVRTFPEHTNKSTNFTSGNINMPLKGQVIVKVYNFNFKKFQFQFQFSMSKFSISISIYS